MIQGFVVNGVSGAGVGGGTDPLAADGPLALLIHGAGMDRTVWSLQTRWLNHHDLPTVALDLPGHGAAESGPLESITAYADWVAGVASALSENGRSVHLVGHSMGTYVALEAARHAPIASLTLVGTAAAMPVHPTLVEAAAANDPLAAQLMSGWAFAHDTRTAAHPSPGASMVGGAQALIERSRNGVLHADLSMCAGYEGAADAVAAYKQPITFLLGRGDRMTPRRGAQALIDAADDPRVEEVDCGHMLPIEAPRRTREVIAATVASAT